MTELIEYQTVTAIVENVEQAKADVQRAFELFNGARERLAAVLGGNGHRDGLWSGRISDYSLAGSAKESQEYITRNAWRYILRKTEIEKLMSQKRQEELHEQIEKNELPPLTTENIMGTLYGLAGRVNSLLDEAVKEVFDSLRPWNTPYKTNERWKVGEKAIISRAVESDWGRRLRVCFYSETKIEALGKVFSLLDGRGVPVYPNDLYTKLNVALKEGRRYEDEYFVAVGYKNGNLHLRFKRLDLLAKLNKIGGGEDLPGQERGENIA